MQIGYARVSTADQKLEPQVDILRAAGCEKIFTDTASGIKSERPGLADALSHLRAGDSLVVFKLDRLGRSLPHLIQTVDGLGQQGIEFKSLKENLDTSTAGGKFLFHIFGAVAEFERELIRERTLAGISSARARGRLGGRPRALTQEKIEAGKVLAADRNRTVGEICEILGCSRSIFYRHIHSRSASNANSGSGEGMLLVSATPEESQEPEQLPAEKRIAKWQMANFVRNP